MEAACTFIFCSSTNLKVVVDSQTISSGKLKDAVAPLLHSQREAIPEKKSQNCGLFPYGGGGGAQPHYIAFGGVFPNITEAILVDEISKNNVKISPPKVIS